MIAYASQHLLDYYHANYYVQEFWAPARFHYQTGIDYDIHDPYTDAFNKSLVASYTGDDMGLAAGKPDGKSGMTVI